MLDILIRGAQVIDGSGSKAFRADIGVQDGKIAEIGPLPQATAETVIDGAGLVAAPGFVDMHSHSDTTLPINGRAESKIRQGVTTEVIGMCGSSPAPLSEAQREEERRQATGADKLLTWDWLTFGEYLDHLRGNGISVNVVPLAGHGTIRVAAMGHSATLPTEAELAQMKALLSQTMDEGAWGLSTGLIYPPGIFSNTAELIELARVAAAKGGFYFSHIRGEGATLFEALGEAITIGEQAGLPVETAHFKASGQSHWDKVRPALDMLDAARRRGVDITSDMYPYTASSTGLGALLPGWVHEGGRDVLLGRLADPETRAKIYQEMQDDVDPVAGEEQWAGVLISRCPAKPEVEGKTIAQLAEEGAKSPVDTVLDLLLGAEGAVSMIQFKMSEENVRLQLQHGPMMIGSDGSSLGVDGPLAEGKPHPRNFGTFPRVLAKYVREEGILTLEGAVHKMTGLPAAKLRLRGRGLLQPGYWADIVLFDAATVADRGTFTAPQQYPAGIPYVVVNGEVTIARGEHVGTLAGRVLAR